MEYLLSEWVRHFHQPGLLREGDKIYAAYVARVSGGLFGDVSSFQLLISSESCVSLVELVCVHCSCSSNSKAF